jgi:hypothetical protein
MSIARFHSRIADSIQPLLVPGANVQQLLGNTSVRLEAPDNLEQHPHHLAGFFLAVNLCARLYPHIHVTGPTRVVAECKQLILSINPACALTESQDRPQGILTWAAPRSEAEAVVIAPNGWAVAVDLPDSESLTPTNALVGLAAGAIGCSELFRTVFGDNLVNGRRGPAPGRFNLLSLRDTPVVLPELSQRIDLGRVHLVGAGAIGQAAAYALARVPVTGTLVVLDSEELSLSNLQRYVLSNDNDIGLPKPAIVARALAGSGLSVEPIQSLWGDKIDPSVKPETVCVAVDSAETRIGIQAALPRRLYNAWTQPADIGWSRHERFGVEPCLACLYYPSGQRPSQHDLIGAALRQDPLRVLGYLTHRLATGVPLSPEQIPRLTDTPLPSDWASWTQRSILEDVAISFDWPLADLEAWRTQSLADLYREGICGGAIVRNAGLSLESDAVVPVAHQSALAGIMLATELIVASSPSLCSARPSSIERRLDLLKGMPQIVERPRQRTIRCICSDPDYQAAFQRSWGE